MNRQRLEKLKEIVLSKHHDSEEESEFDMSDFFSSCGAPQCICGWAIAIFVPEKTPNPTFEPVWDLGAEVLGLDLETAEELFMPNSVNKSYNEITTQEAAQAIQNVLDFGEPRWDQIT